MRKHPNWIRSYMDLVRHTEPPARYHIWVAITILAAAMSRRCEIHLGTETFFPNLYTVLVGPPGVRKGTAIRYGTRILDDVGIVKTIPAGRITGPAFYIELENAREEVYTDQGMWIHHSLFVVADELVVFMGKDDIDRIADLCKLYDGDPVFQYKTKHAGTNYIHNPGLWLLGATTPHWIQQSMKQLAIGGGMTSRTIFVFAGKKDQHCSLTKMPPLDQKLRGELIEDLSQVCKMSGEFKMDSAAIEAYDHWYMDIHPRITLNDDRFLHYLDRLPSMVIKVSMIFSAARDDSYRITQNDVVRAVNLFNDLHVDMPRAFGGMGMNPIGAQTEMVREKLRLHKELPKSHIMQSLKMHISHWDMQRIESALLEERFLKFEYRGELEAKEKWYILVEAEEVASCPVDEFNNLTVE